MSIVNTAPRSPAPRCGGTTAAVDVCGGYRQGERWRLADGVLDPNGACAVRILPPGHRAAVSRNRRDRGRRRRPNPGASPFCVERGAQKAGIPAPTLPLPSASPSASSVATWAQGRSRPAGDESARSKAPKAEPCQAEGEKGPGAGLAMVPLPHKVMKTPNPQPADRGRTQNLRSHRGVANRRPSRRGFPTRRSHRRPRRRRYRGRARR